MQIKTEAKITSETTVHFHKGKFKNHPADLGEWWGEETCKEIDFSEALNEINVPEGKYKVTLIIEKIE